MISISFKRIATAIAAVVAACCGSVSAAEERLAMPADVQAILSSRCADCHTGDAAEAGVRIDNFNTLSRAAQLELMNRAQDQIFFKLMPPEDGEPLEAAEHTKLAGWLRSELRRNNASKLDEKLRHPAYGNMVDHDKLFNGSIDAAPFTPARRWLVSPQIFIERVNAVFQLEGRARQRKFYGVTNPIVLPDHSGIRYYDTTSLDGGHLLVMLNNAEWISSKQIFGAVHQGENSRNLTFDNPKDRWYPTNPPEAFVAIVKKETPPSGDELSAAVKAQFDCVLQREPTAPEMKQYTALLRDSIQLGGNQEGLRQMLVAVLLKSEFLYRLEFGAGEADEHGRRKLSPHEATYAIAYALTDRVPDQQLRDAAREGRLQTKEDYRREVLRILNDKRTYYDEGAPELNGIHHRSHRVTHPRVNRFFREFFGYPNSVKLFKDISRSGGFYDNAGRGYTGTAGSVTDEADRVVDGILMEDKDVFARLLTTDKFFVLHTKSDEENLKIIAGWRKAYEGLKDLDWENETEKTLLDNFEKHKDLFKLIRIENLNENRRRVHVRDFKRFMQFFDNTFGQGLTPITFPWFYHGGQKFRHSPIYNLPQVPGGAPVFLGGTKYRDRDEVWDFPPVQPFKVPHRKGILTHPAWLLAHSQNTETDPVRRGRWVREKLLAGRVPDVPITVDAQIPEDHHRTLRQRLDSVTGKQQCWKCHQHMNPLGLTFEIFDDFGRFRTQESLEHPDNILKKATRLDTANIYKTAPVNAKGELTGTGDPSLDGPVQDAFDLIDRLAKSERVRQSFIRHAFRYFMGRNEMLSDSKTLIAADNAYVENGGSFKAVIVSLLTSDSFMYRKDVKQ